MNAAAEALIAAMSATPDRVPAIGTRRRVRALVRLGWPVTTLASRAGLSRTMLHNVATARSMLCDREVVAAVDRLYRDLSMIPGPSRAAAARAASRGWAPPLAWDEDGGPHDIDTPTATPTGATEPNDQDQPYATYDRRTRTRVWEYDEIAVVRTCRGDRPARTLTPPEQLEVARRLDGRVPQHYIQRYLGISGTAITALMRRARRSDAAEGEAA